MVFGRLKAEDVHITTDKCFFVEGNGLRINISRNPLPFLPIFLYYFGNVSSVLSV